MQTYVKACFRAKTKILKENRNTAGFLYSMAYNTPEKAIFVSSKITKALLHIQHPELTLYHIINN